jgi:hypothetical protein
MWENGEKEGEKSRQQGWFVRKEVENEKERLSKRWKSRKSGTFWNP